MKKITGLFIALAFIFACNNSEKQTTTTEAETTEKELAYASFGDKISAEDVLSKEDIIATYDNLKVGDTINTKMAGTIKEVCSKKGCWMTLDLNGEDEVMVKFKDYGFFMPLNAKGDVIVNGKAFVSETTVEELRHYAEDAGKSEEEIASITTPERTLSFVADGVLLQQ